MELLGVVGRTLADAVATCTWLERGRELVTGARRRCVMARSVAPVGSEVLKIGPDLLVHSPLRVLHPLGGEVRE